MTTPISRRNLLGLAGVGAGAMLLAACGGEAPPPAATGPQTVDWWHIQTGDPIKPVWLDLANQYHAAHSDVTIKPQDYENQAFKDKLTTVTQAGDPPDLFQSWGGGVLAQQVDAGLVKDLTNDISSWVGDLTPAAMQPYTIDGKVYGVAWDIGMVGFWYNKELFDKAKVTAPPASWAELLEVVRKLKAANVVPIALAGKEKWPGHFYWAYLAMRVAGLDALKAAADSKSFDNPDFVTAGTRLKELVDLAPFQKGFLAAEYGSPDGQAAAVGNGLAGMELMGQWAPAVQKDNSKDKKGLGDKLGFFQFPAVDGGKGKPSDAFGGGNGFAVGKNAPPATIDFLKFLLNAANQRRVAETGAVLPTNKNAQDGIKDPNNQTVAKALASATGFQLYLDQAYPPAVGAQVNDSVAELIAGTKSADEVTKDITQTAQEN
jgi:raffinose/stachyose/melibiose transport system substrate-binding protein